MDQVLQILKSISAPRPRNHNWQPAIPYDQPYYTFSEADQRWRAIDPGSAIRNRNSESSSAFTLSSSFDTTKFTIYSWNIDFMLPQGSERLTAALAHLASDHHLSLTNDNDNTKPMITSILLLQEMTPQDLHTLRSTPWIRQHYYLTDISNEYWASTSYGTCILIPKPVHIKRVFRVHYPETLMERDGLFVDLALTCNKNEDQAEADDNEEEREESCLRICCTHLESLALEPPRRPAQMRCAARFMKGLTMEEEKEGGERIAVKASVLGGDLNAIQPFDQTLHSDNGLGDAYLATGGIEGHIDGQTWGQMARTTEREKFGLSRMDKLFFTGFVAADNFETFGYDVEVEGQENRKMLLESGLERPWVTDHMGIKGVFNLSEGLTLQ